MRGYSNIALMVCCLAFSACNSKPIPKPEGRLRIDLPTPRYETLKSPLPFQFEISDLVQLHIDTLQSSPCAINLHYPTLGATIYGSYLGGDPQRVTKLLGEAEALLYRQGVRPNQIKAFAYEEPIERVYATLYQMDGRGHSIASPLQFVVTDSTTQLFRGALYFDNTAVTDSLFPVISYLQTDIAHIIETFNWK